MPAILHVMFPALAVALRAGGPLCKATSCERGWVQLGAKCYKTVSSMSLSWFDAQVFCQALGGGLVSPKNPTEIVFVRNLAKTQRLLNAWIGVFDANDRQWMTSQDARPVSVTDWGVGEPNNHRGVKENCVGLYIDYKWNDGPCNIPQPFICQKAAR